VQDSAAKLWETYYENERKCVYSQTERIQSQLQSVSVTSMASSGCVI